MSMVNPTYAALSTEVKNAIASFKQAVGINKLSIISNVGTGEISLATSLYYYMQTQQQAQPSSEFERVMDILRPQLKRLQDILAPNEIFALVAAYPLVVEYALDFLGKDSISSHTAVWCQNRELTKFVAELFRHYTGTSEELTIYNPFMGLGSYATVLPDCHFVGEEISDECWALAQVNLHAHKCNAELRLGDSFDEMKNSARRYDAVVMTPPFGLRGGFTEFDALDLAFQKVKDGGMVFCVLPMSFCSARRSYAIRRKLIKYGAIGNVIALPSMLFGAMSSVPTCLVILKKASTDHFFVTDGRTFVSVDEDEYPTPMFSYRGLAEKICWEDSQYVKVINKDSLNDNYDITPAKLMLRLEESKYVTKQLSDLITIRRNGYVSGAKGHCIMQSSLSDDYFDCRIKEGTLSTHRKVRAQRIEHECIVLSLRYAKSFHFAKVAEADIIKHSPLYAMQHCVAFNVNENVISADYLLYALQSEYVKKQAEAATTSSTVGMISLEDLKSLRIPVPTLSEQADIISLQRSIYSAKLEQERKAENARKGIRQTTSDLVHMLNTPLCSISNIINHLENDVTEEGAQRLTALKDNFDFIKRLIRLDATDFTSLPKSQIELKEFFERYVQAYSNFGAETFQLSFQNYLEFDDYVIANADALSVMMDCMLDNANRHGFNKKYSEGNLVEIMAEVVKPGDEDMLLLCISNNGVPFPDGFTIEDFSSRGRYTGNSGRSGIGGAHVSEIIKSMGGTIDVIVDNPDAKDLSEIGVNEIWTRFIIQLPANSK